MNGNNFFVEHINNSLNENNDFLEYINNLLKQNSYFVEYINNSLNQNNYFVEYINNLLNQNRSFVKRIKLFHSILQYLSNHYLQQSRQNKKYVIEWHSPYHFETVIVKEFLLFINFPFVTRKLENKSAPIELVSRNEFFYFWTSI